MTKKKSRSGATRAGRSATQASTENAKSREQKRARFAKTERMPSRSPSALLIVLAAVVVGLGAVYGSTQMLGGRTDPAPPVTGEVEVDSLKAGQALPVAAATSGHEPYPALAAVNGVVRLPLSVFDDGLAHHYTYMNGDQPIEFFALKSKDGVVRAAFNACDVCFRVKLGYHQDGDEMVCANCGRRFPSDRINVVKGGCNPSPLARTVEGSMLVIKVDDIVAGAQYF